MIHVYGKPTTRAARVLWLLEELELPFELHPVDPQKGEHLQPDFWRINPFGKVPCISVDNYSLAESSAICTWLADQHPDRGLIPAAGTRARGTHDQWMSFAMTEMEAHLWLAFRNTAVLPESQRVAAILPQAMDFFAASCKILSAHLQVRPFVLGEQFSVVDIFMTSILNWAKMLEAPGLDRGLLDYRERMTQRPAYQAFRTKYLKKPSGA